jgi:hypothetical protein
LRYLLALILAFASYLKRGSVLLRRFGGAIPRKGHKMVALEQGELNSELEYDDRVGELREAQALLFFLNALHCRHFGRLVGSGHFRSLGRGLVGTHAGENA